LMFKWDDPEWAARLWGGGGCGEEVVVHGRGVIGMKGGKTATLCLVTRLENVWAGSSRLIVIVLGGSGPSCSCLLSSHAVQRYKCLRSRWTVEMTRKGACGMPHVSCAGDDGPRKTVGEILDRRVRERSEKDADHSRGSGV
jgi:hypothetical protein